MNVTMIDYTGAGAKNPSRHAINTLIFTKSTRLKLSPSLMDEIRSWDDERVKSELEYMANTIPSSWEFVHYTFLITGVTRAFTHQLVRTRTASFAQQTMRILEMDGWTYGTGPSFDEHPEALELYDGQMASIDETYKKLIKMGAAVEDARGVLPTNIHTNIVVSMNLRNLCDLMRKRASTRTQDEYRLVVEAVRKAIIEVHPFASIFLSRSADKALYELEREIISLGLDQKKRIDMIKLCDQIRIFM